MKAAPEDAYKPAVSFVVLGSIVLALSLWTKDYLFAGFSGLCYMFAVVIMLEKIADAVKGK